MGMFDSLSGGAGLLGGGIAGAALGGLLGGGGGSTPAIPDYAALAQQTAANQLAASQAATKANRVNQTNPFGSVQYTQNPDGTWSANTSLSSPEQGLLNTQQQNAATAGSNAAGILSNPSAAFSDVAKMPVNAGMTAQNAIMSRLQPQIDRENTQSDAQLAAQGITPGSEAYNNSKTLLNQNHNDLLNQAASSGVGLDMNAATQGTNNAATQLNAPIQAATNLQNLANPTLPNQSFVNPAQQQTTAGADPLAAAQMTYQGQLGNQNAQTAQTNGLLGAVGQVGGAALSAGVF